MTRLRGAMIVAAGLSFALPQRAAAQDTVVVVQPGEVPSRTSQVEQWAVDLFNDPATTRAVGALNVDRDARYTSNVVVLNGPLMVAGTIEGDLVAINSDVEIRSTAVIEGSVLVLGGTLVDEAGARIRGSLRRYSRRLDVRLVEDRLELIEPEPSRERRRTYYGPRRTRFNLLLGLGGTYNRVEGLPLRLGAKIDWRGPAARAQIRGYGIFRTAGDFTGSREDIGYSVDGNIRFGTGPRSITLGGRYYDVVVPTQQWPLELNEVGWATFLWRRDYRDYFLQRGGWGFLTLQATHHLKLTAEYSRMEESSIAARDPWTPFRKDQEWRPNVAIDSGKFTLVSAVAEYDSRPGRRSRRSGVLLRFRWDRGIADSVVENTLPESVRSPLPLESYTWDRAEVDVRLYQRIDWGGQLRLRGYWAGTIGKDPLPIQRRYSLGGPDPMNGYAFREYACNETVDDLAQPGLCDRVLLLQAEYRGHIGFDWFEDELLSRSSSPDSWDDFGDWDWGDRFWFDGPTVVLFSNAGTGWLDGQPMPSLGFDIGAGIEFGSAGLYVAKALKDGEPVRWTLRIEGRF